MIDSDSEFVRHEPCSACGSSDALARYSDNHAHCFSCGHYEHGDGSVSFHKPQRTMDFTETFRTMESLGFRIEPREMDTIFEALDQPRRGLIDGKAILTFLGM